MFESSIWFCFVVAKEKKVAYKGDIKLIFVFGSIDSGEEIPGYISNPEVKLICGEGSARGTECENSKTLPYFFILLDRKYIKSPD